MSKRVAVVTGANKGIGFGIVRGLCKEFVGDIILTARDEGRGKAAVEELEKEGLKPKFHQLDITDHDSVVRLRDFLKENYGGLDVLVNNAGVAFHHSQVPIPMQAMETMKVNFFGTLDVSRVLFPLLRPHARVCNVSSIIASMSLITCSPEVQALLTNPNITMRELSDLMTHYVRLTHENRHIEEGFSDNPYGFSKIGMTILTTLQQQELDRQGAEDIVVNACSPGIVRTSLNNWKGHLTVEEGVITPLYCALLPPNIESPRGAMLREKEVVDWINWANSDAGASLQKYMSRGTSK